VFSLREGRALAPPLLEKYWPPMDIYNVGCVGLYAHLLLTCCHYFCPVFLPSPLDHIPTRTTVYTPQNTQLHIPYIIKVINYINQLIIH